MMVQSGPLLHMFHGTAYKWELAWKHSITLSYLCMVSTEQADTWPDQDGTDSKRSWLQTEVQLTRRTHGYTLGSQPKKPFERGYDNDPVKNPKKNQRTIKYRKRKIKDCWKVGICIHSLTPGLKKILLETIRVFIYQVKNWENTS